MFIENARYSAQKRKLGLLKFSGCLNGWDKQAFMNKVQDYKPHSFYKLVKKTKQKITLKVGFFFLQSTGALEHEHSLKCPAEEHK